MTSIAAMSFSSEAEAPLTPYRQAVKHTEFTRRLGWVRQVKGMAIHSQGPDVSIGELCRIRSDIRPGQLPGNTGVLAEVVGFSAGMVTLVPFGSGEGIREGAEVVALGRDATVSVGPALVGRVIDGFGEALDGLGKPVTLTQRPLRGVQLNPMSRPPVEQILETGIRSIDGLLTIGQGQRLGIFAGSGVGKSTLLGMIARHVKADVNVIALIGERGREVRDFIERQLGPEGLSRSLIVVATAEQPAPARIRAAYAAVTIAEYFREQGKQVLLTMDSITRLAMARREVGLAAGEPPTARGYTPSVFAELPQLCERFGTSDSGGAITALLTVLVEGDDFNEPISDHLRAILDGHIVLSRKLAHCGHYPAIDVLQSASRLRTDLTGAADKSLVEQVLKHIGLVERNRQMVEIGAYESGSNAVLDRALACDTSLTAWLTQKQGGAERLQAMKQLQSWGREASTGAASAFQTGVAR